ncbi:MAG: hypothetical protein Harvfovirus16_17, partial [Harvfovirus sp.]
MRVINKIFSQTNYDVNYLFDVIGYLIKLVQEPNQNCTV